MRQFWQHIIVNVWIFCILFSSIGVSISQHSCITQGFTNTSIFSQASCCSSTTLIQQQINCCSVTQKTCASLENNKSSCCVDTNTYLSLLDAQFIHLTFANYVFTSLASVTPIYINTTHFIASIWQIPQNNSPPPKYFGRQLRDCLQSYLC